MFFRSVFNAAMRQVPGKKDLPIYMLYDEFGHSTLPGFVSTANTIRARCTCDARIARDRVHDSSVARSSSPISSTAGSMTPFSRTTRCKSINDA